MTLLRWMIGIGCVLALAFFALAMLVGKGIRSAYQSGAGVTDVLRETAVYAIPMLLIAMLVSVCLPPARILLHVVGAGVLAAMLGCALVIRDAPGEGTMYLGFLGLWMLYYLLVVFGKTPAGM